MIAGRTSAQLNSESPVSCQTAWVLAGLIASALLSACGGGGGGSGSAPPPVPQTGSVTVSGTITGLTASGLQLQNNGVDTIAAAANATSFTFATAISSGAAYAVTVKTQPSGQSCIVSSGTGTASSANIVNVTVACTTSSASTYTVSGIIVGLSASGLQLQNNGADTISVAANATSFTFATGVASGAAYAVTVKTQPSGQSCIVSNGTGTASSANIANVTVACGMSSSSTYTVSGTINGLSASGLIIDNTGTDDLSLAAGATAFTFATHLPTAATYQIIVKTLPDGEVCTVTNGSGTITNANIVNVVITCTPYYTPGGTVSNLKGTTLSLLLQNGGGYASNVVSVLPGQATFVFGTGLPKGTGYTVTVQQQPSGQLCTVTNGTGAVSSSNVASINVSCVTVPQWAWISGDDSSLGAIYGTLGQAATGNSPGGRGRSATSVDMSGNLWLFGGANAGNGLTNDLWFYSKSTGEWTWLGGPSSTNGAGVYGTQGISANANVPGARFGAVSWTDSAGNFWLFGGQGYDSTGTQGWLSDLWEYSSATGQWLWVSGSSLGNAPGVYGSAGVAATNNQPGGRYYAVGWIDAGNHLWIYGGAGIDVNGNQNTLNDLWEFDGRTGLWTWINGSPSGYVTGVYGTQGVADGANAPGSRQQATAWTDSAGQLWLFGGYGLDAAGTYDALNDLWRYSFASGFWTWMGGSTIVDARGVYGVQGTAAAANVPGARYGATSWIDVNGAFWLLGGEGYDSTNYNSNIQNDIWKYDSTSGDWSWIGGGSSDGGGDPGVYQVQGLPGAGNSPGARTSATSWTDASGSWIYGGIAASPLKPGASSYTISQGANDLWHLGTAIFYNGAGSMGGTFTDQNGCQYPAPVTIVNANVTMSTQSAGAVTLTYTVPALASLSSTCPNYGANSGTFSVPVTVNGAVMQGLAGSIGSVSAIISGGVVSGTVGFQETGTQGSGTFSWTESGSFSTVAVPVTVPNLVGLIQAAATVAINGAGLSIGNITYQNNEMSPAGNVISQTPDANSTVATASSVSLIVSSGPSSPSVTDQIAIDSSVPAPARSVITTLVSGAGSAPSSVTSISVPAATASGQAIVMATDAANNVYLLGQLAPDGSVTLSAASTAQALALIALEPLPSNVTLSEITSAIANTAEYPNLVSQVSSALAASTPPANSPLVLASLSTIASQVLTAFSPATPSALRSNAARMVLTNTRQARPLGAAPPPLPYALVTSPTNATVIALNDKIGNGVQLSNVSLIEWDASSVDITGNNIATATLPALDVWGSIGSIATTGGVGSTPLAGNGTQFLTVVQQDTHTQTFNIVNLIATVTDASLDKITALSGQQKTCAGGTITTLVNEKLPDLIANHDAAAIKAYVAGLFSAKAVSGTIDTIYKCAGLTVAEEAAASTLSVVVAAVQLSVTVGTEYGILTQQSLWWGQSFQVEICKSNSAIVSCALTIQAPNSFLPVGQQEQLTAENASSQQPLPSSELKWTTTSTLLTLSPSGQVTAGTAAGSAVIQAADPYQDSATINLTIGVPLISPQVPSAGVGKTLQLSLVDPSSNALTLNPPWQWSSNSPSIATVDPDSGLVTAVADGIATIIAQDPISKVTTEPVQFVVADNPSFVGTLQGTLPLQGFTFACSPGPTCTTNDVTFGVTIGQDGSVGTSPINQNGNWFITNCIVCSPFGTFYDWTLTSGTVAPCAPTAPAPCQSGSAIVQLNYSERATSQDGLDYCNFTIVLTPGTAGVTPTAEQGSICNYVGKGVQAVLNTNTGPPAITFTPSSQ
jgi:hypothetical protein